MRAVARAVIPARGKSVDAPEGHAVSVRTSFCWNLYISGLSVPEERVFYDPARAECASPHRVTVRRLSLPAPFRGPLPARPSEGRCRTCFPVP